MRYTKKPVTIEAVQLVANDEEIHPDEYPDWIENALACAILVPRLYTDEDGSRHHYAEVVTLEGTMRATPGDYIIQGIHGELYPCKPDIFEESYVPAKKPGKHAKAHEPGMVETVIDTLQEMQQDLREIMNCEGVSGRHVALACTKLEEAELIASRIEA